MFIEKDIRSGTIRNNLKGELAFESFVPKDLQEIDIEYSDALVSLLGKVHRSLGELSQKWKMIDSQKQEEYLKKCMNEEADDSIRLAIDATFIEEPLKKANHTIGLINLDQLNFNDKPLKGNDLKDKEWLNDSIVYGIERLKTLPMSIRFLCEMHDYILHDDHNWQSTPGQLRHSPIWIGRPESTLKNAAFVPPIVEDMKKGLYQLEKYIHEENDMDLLIRNALIHYQLEVLHPFLDGNGREGRVLSILLLMDQKVLPSPILKLSTILRQKEFQYYINISLIESDGAYERWIQFWLSIIYEASQKAFIDLEGVGKCE